MRNIKLINCHQSNVEKNLSILTNALEKNYWVKLSSGKEYSTDSQIKSLPEGPGVIIRGGGSGYAYTQCLHSCSNLNKSAIATGQWLELQGYNLRQCHIFNPLPINHVSGLLPWWRSKLWGTQYTSLNSQLMNK